MITENLSTLKIHKLTQEQYDREFEAGRIDENALYLTKDDGNNIEVDKTLSIEGQAADAKAVGDALAAERRYVDNVTSNITSNIVGVNSVKFIEQSLTDKQKAQARANIGAMSDDMFYELDLTEMNLSGTFNELSGFNYFRIIDKINFNEVKNALASGKTIRLRLNMDMLDLDSYETQTGNLMMSVILNSVECEDTIDVSDADYYATGKARLPFAQGDEFFVLRLTANEECSCDLMHQSLKDGNNETSDEITDKITDETIRDIISDTTSEKFDEIRNDIEQHTSKIMELNSVIDNIAEVQEQQIQQNADAIAALPISTSVDGYTEIAGLRKPLSIQAVFNNNAVIMTTVLQGDVTYTDVITLDDNGYPISLTSEGINCTMNFVGFGEEATTNEV